MDSVERSLITSVDIPFLESIFDDGAISLWPTLVLYMLNVLYSFVCSWFCGVFNCCNFNFRLVTSCGMTPLPTQDRHTERGLHSAGARDPPMRTPGQYRPNDNKIAVEDYITRSYI